MDASPKSSTSVRFQLPDTVIFQEMDGEVVILNLASQQYFGLNSVGASIWNLLLSGADVGTIEESLEGEFEVERDVLHADVERLLEQLAGSGLIRKCDRDLGV